MVPHAKKDASALNRIANRLDGISESATLRLNAAVQAMKAQGEPVVNLTAGEPDFPVPDAAKEAVFEAVRADRSKYTPVAGIPELRKAIADKTNSQQPSLSKPWTAADVVVTNGGKQAIYNVFQALLNPGDEVLIPAPYWLSYPDMVKLAGGVPKILSTTIESRFKISPKQLQSSISDRTKILVLNSPSNPTGAMYSRSELTEIGKVIAENPSVIVVSDEIYDRIILGTIPFCSFLESSPSLRERTVTVNGMSKSAAMTGWRIGWSVAPADITQAVSTLQGQSTSGINALAQWASVAAMKLPESQFASQVERYRKRRELCLEILRNSRKIVVLPPDGAFYLFVGVGRCLKAGEDSLGFAERLLAGAKVAVVPGTPFGMPDYLRLSFATDEDSLREGCYRLVEFVEK